MSEQNNRSKVIAEHEYNGIQEYDNPTPGWWIWLFILTVIFAVGYFAYYQIGTGASIISLYEEAKANESKFGELKEDGKSLVSYMNNENMMASAKSIYSTYCIACHGPNGEGTAVGPNMTDNFYKNVKSIEEIPDVIRNGANNNLMPPWRTQLDKNQVIIISAYMASLRGKNLTGPRPAEGEEIPPWPK